MKHKLSSRHQGFTLIELLVVVSIIAVLSSLSVAGVKGLISHAKKTREISAARSLVSAYLLYPADHNGMMMRAYDEGAKPLELPDGRRISGAAAHRYPWRLAQYFDAQINNTIIINDLSNQYNINDDYLVSLYPALGINSNYLGGIASATSAPSGDAISHINQASTPILAFASAYHNSQNEEGDGVIQGFHSVTAPNTTSRVWKNSTELNDNTKPDDYGNVDFRFNGKAVCAFLDGAVRMLNPEELKDMRLWSYRAARANNENYMMTSKSSSTNDGGGRGR